MDSHLGKGTFDNIEILERPNLEISESQNHKTSALLNSHLGEDGEIYQVWQMSKPNLPI